MFSCGERSLFEYECACIYGFWTLLSEDGQRKLEKQFQLYDRVQRSANGKHLGFFDDESDGLCSTWAQTDLFPFKEGPCAVASIDLAIPGNSKKVNAEIFFYAGRFAGIEFDKNIKSTLQKKREVMIKDAKVASFSEYAAFLERQVMLIDPMKRS